MTPMPPKSSHGVLPGGVPILFYPELAKCFGVCESLIIQQVHWYTTNQGRAMEGHKWTWRSIKEWSAMLMMGSATIERAMSHLRAESILIVGEFNKHKYDKTKWYRLNYEVLTIKLMDSIPSNCGNEMPSIWSEETTTPSKGCDTPHQKDGDHPIKMMEPIHKKEYKNEDKRNTLASQPSAQPPVGTEGKEMLPKNGMKKGPTSSGDVASKLMVSSVDKKSAKVADLYKVWATEIPRHHAEVKFVGPFSVVQKGQMSNIAKVCGQQTGEVISYLIEHWVKFGKFVAAQTGTKMYPESPNIGYLLKHVSLGMSFFLGKSKAKDASVQLIAPVKPEVDVSEVMKPVVREKQEPQDGAVKRIGKITLKRVKAPGDSQKLSVGQGDTQALKEPVEPLGALAEVGLVAEPPPPDNTDSAAAMAELVKFKMMKKKKFSGKF